MTLIKYGISKDYLLDWSYQEVLREIYQNFTDYGDFDEDMVDLENGNCTVSLYNKFRPQNLRFLSIGDSSKRDDKNTVGKHGEGLKMALFVLSRSGSDSFIMFDGKAYEPTFYMDEQIGECFGIKFAGKCSIKNGFAVTFDIPKEQIDLFKSRQISKEEVIFSHQNGDIIDKLPGSIYVGGVYVCIMKEVKYAYNFKPSRINLDRDRKIPTNFDINWNASAILSKWEKLTVDDLFSSEGEYIDNIPSKLLRQVKPEIIDGEVVFRFGKHTAKGSLAKNLMVRMETNVRKLKEQLVSETSPYKIMKDFQDNHGYSLCEEAKIDLKIILDNAVNWKKRKNKLAECV